MAAKAAKDECEILMGELFSLGESLLKKNNEFFPFAAVMDLDGTIRQLAYYDGNDMPDSKDLITDLKKLCKQLAENKEIKVSGIAWDARISDGGKEEDAKESFYENVNLEN